MENQDTTMAEELQQLREQYATLKEAVDKQNAINEQFVLSSINKSLNAINGKRRNSLVVCLISIPLIIYVSIALGLRWPFIVVSVAWLLFLHMGNWLRNKEIAIDSLSTETVSSFAAEMKRRMNSQFRWVRINYVCFILWVGYFIGELAHTGMPKQMLLPIIGGICIGAAIGVMFGMRIHNRIIGVYEGVILDLKNL